MELVNEITGLREDYRKPDEVRPIELKFCDQHRVDASLYYAAGGTKLLVRFSGPSEPSSHLNPNRRQRRNGFLDIHVQCQLEGIAPEFNVGIISQLLSQSLRSCIIPEEVRSSHSRCSVFLTVFENDGSLVAHCVTAGLIAAAYAGMPLRDMAVACTAGLSSSNVVLFDLSQDEFASRIPKFTAVVCPRSGSIVAADFDGRVLIDDLTRLRAGVVDGARKMSSFIMNALQAAANRNVHSLAIDVPIKSVAQAAKRAKELRLWTSQQQQQQLLDKGKTPEISLKVDDQLEFDANEDDDADMRPVDAEEN